MTLKLHVSIQIYMVNDPSQNLTQQIATEFSRRGISTCEAAREADVSQASFYRWIKGTSPRGAYRKVALAWLEQSLKKSSASSAAGNQS